jgi:hypothetical protein
MTTDSFFALAIGGMLALFFGTLLLLAGYRFFLVLLPILGFFFGFGLGAQTVQALFGTGFLSTVTGWIVGFGVAVLFAVLSYLFYFMAVGLIGGMLGYALGVGLMQAIGFDMGFLVWLVGIVAAIVVGAAVLFLNVQKWVVIASTAILGAAVITGTFLFMFGGPAAQIAQNPVRAALNSSPLLTISFLLLAILGGVAQFQTTSGYEVESYNRFADMSGAEPAPVGGPVAI